MLFLCCLIIATLFDLQISTALYNPKSTFGWFFESFGEMIIFLIGGFSSLFLIIVKDRKKRLSTVIYGFLYLFNLLGFIMIISTHLKVSSLMLIPLVVIYLMVTILLVRAVPKENYSITKKIAMIGLILSLAPIFIINIIKMIWGRPRFRSMSNPSLQFTPWYLPQGLTTNNEFMSFPSGHAANSSTILWITLLPYAITSLKSIVKPITGFAIIWFICVMVSRIIMGAHFMSDVVIGASITITLFLLLKRRYLKNHDI